MEKTFSFTVNGQPRTVTTDPARPLLDVLREDLQLTGVKYGCGEGYCRACTILMGGKSTLACLTPIERAEGQTIVTIEGLAENEVLHPVQEAFLAEGASQCGYCTPGMILETAGLLKQIAKPSDADIRSRMEGHICRCCNYVKIFTAIRRVANTTK